MAISLRDIRQSVQGPPRIVVYGVAGIGKTTLASYSPAPIFIPVEDGMAQTDAPCFPRPETYQQVMECIETLINERHQYQTVVLDSLDAMESKLWAHVSAECGKKNIEDFGFGKGYEHAAAEWRNLLAGFDALRSQGMNVVLVAHSTVARVEPPELDPYDRYQLRLHKKADAVVCDWADCVLFANYKVTAVRSGAEGSERKRGVGDGSRSLFATERPAWRAKNRYSMADSVVVDAATKGRETMKSIWAKISTATATTAY